MGDFVNYLNEFGRNLSENNALFRRYDIRGDKEDPEREEADKVIESKIVEDIKKGSQGVINDQDILEAVKRADGKDKRSAMEDVLGVDASEVDKRVRKEKRWNKILNYYKEQQLIGLAATGAVLVTTEDIEPVFKYVLGPLFIKIGIDNSDVLQKVLGRHLDRLKDNLDIDLEKGFPEQYF
jgi:hypothetical protein